jgi:hypothetical protein
MHRGFKGTASREREREYGGEEERVKHKRENAEADGCTTVQ